MNKILVPFDFSDVAYNAFEVARHLAYKTNASLKLLHIVELPMPPSASIMGEPIPASVTSQSMELAREMIEQGQEKLSKIAKDYPDINIQTEVVKEIDSLMNASIADNILAYNADLVVMGSHGAKGIKELIMGSNAEKIVRESPAPVLVVKNRHQEFKADNIVYATDFHNDNPTNIDQLKDFAEIFKAKINLLYVTTPLYFLPTQDIYDKMNAFVKEFQLKNYTFNIYNEYSEEKGILQFAYNNDMDLIAMPTHGRTGIAHLIHGSIAEDVVNHALKPILTLNSRSNKKS